GNLRELAAKLKPGLRRVLVEGLGQQRVRGRGLPSWAHGLLFAGFMMLFLGTTLLELDHLATMVSPKLKFHRGSYYVAYEFTLDVFGLLFLLGTVLFFSRRLRRPASLGHRATDWYVLLSFLAIGVTGYLVEALRILWQKPVGLGAFCSPVGLWLSSWFAGVGEAHARSAHFAMWWLHAGLVFGFIASIPFTRLLHFITGPLNLFFARPMLGQLQPMTLQQVEQTGRMGVGEIRHFTQQQLLSLDACMECGRCEEACPAFATAKPLSPKKVVQDLKGVLERLDWWRVACSVTDGRTNPTPTRLATPDSSLSLNVHDTISADTLWSCSTCSACVFVCPVRIDPLTLLLDLRRHRLGEGGLSGTVATALRRMQSSANPWGLPAAERAGWLETPRAPATGGGAASALGSTRSEYRAPTTQENPGFELLYWIGCAGAYDRRAQRVARALVKLLNLAGVDFAILGREEKCTGDSARRLGDEFLFQELAQANIATLARYRVREIVAHCPHCVNAFRHDYPQFGGQYRVRHHTELLADLVRDGRLKVPGEIPASLRGPVTYHDPCYLARVNGIHVAPREVLHRTLADGSRIDLREMARHREKTFCCGAGGGRMWMEEDPQQRVSTLRAQEALATGANTIAVGCPFCLTMMTDGVAAHTSEARVLDVAEILAERLGL
ncbi:MAG: respiratory nitrate reductase subunit gamma, partial [Verrucomicrobia bacterium]|nr:respiratory nitrate reductase subunit gamma [Verrucomicrobiota bacterium]